MNVSGVPAGPVTCIADILRVLGEHVGAHPVQQGEWIIGYGYDVSNLSDGRQLSRDDLDPVFPANPVMLIHSSNHGAVLNSAGFAAVGIDATTPDPAGGLILRKAGSSEPDGLLMETAFLPIFGAMPQPTEEELLERFHAAQQIYARKGITTIQEGATNAKDLKLIVKGGQQGRLYLDVVCLPLVLEVPKLVKEYFPDFSGGPMELPDTAGESFGTYHHRVKLAGIKCLIDGSTQGKTAFWSQPLLTGSGPRAGLFPQPDGLGDRQGAALLQPQRLLGDASRTHADDHHSGGAALPQGGGDRPRSACEPLAGPEGAHD